MRIPALAWTQCEALVSKSENTGALLALARAKILHDTATCRAAKGKRVPSAGSGIGLGLG